MAKTIEDYERLIARERAKQTKAASEIPALREQYGKLLFEAAEEGPTTRKAEREAEKLKAAIDRLESKAAIAAANIACAEDEISRLQAEQKRADQLKNIEDAIGVHNNTLSKANEFLSSIEAANKAWDNFQNCLDEQKTAFAIAGLKDKIAILSDRPSDQTLRLALSSSAPDIADLLGLRYARNGRRLNARPNDFLGVITKLQRENTDAWLTRVDSE